MRKRILCFGDSNTWGFSPGTATRFDEDKRWTALLQSKLGSKFVVIEEGQNGRTCEMDDSAEGEKNAMKYIVPCLESHLPLDLLIIMLGTNDLKVRFDRSTEEIAQGFERLIQKARAFLDAQGSQAHILVVAPIHVRAELTDEAFGPASVGKSIGFAKRYENIALAHHCAFLDAARVAEASPIDCVHMDAEDHAKLASAIYEKVVKLL